MAQVLARRANSGDSDLLGTIGTVVGSMYGGPAGGAAGGAVGSQFGAPKQGGIVEQGAMARRAQPAAQDKVGTLMRAQEALAGTSQEYQSQVSPIIAEALRRAQIEEQNKGQKPGAMYA